MKLTIASLFLCLVLVQCSLSVLDTTIHQQQDETCVVYDFECVEPGDTCESSADCSTTEGGVCRSCKGYDECISTCPSDYYGRQCSDDDECNGLLTDKAGACNNNNECEQTNSFRLDGDKCESASECYSNLTCTNGKCVGIANGDACSTRFECQYSQYCNSGVCADRIAPGQPCSQAETCEYKDGRFYECNIIQGSGTCVEGFSLEKGDACSDLFLCADGLTCVAGECKEPVDGGDECDPGQNDACKDKGTCACNSEEGAFECTGFGTIPISDCEGDLNDLIECTTEHECITEGPWQGLVAGTCTFDNCGDEFREAFSCVNRAISGGSEERACYRAYSAGSTMSSFLSFLW